MSKNLFSTLISIYSQKTPVCVNKFVFCEITEIQVIKFIQK